MLGTGLSIPAVALARKQGGVVIPKLPANSSIVFVGDSITFLISSGTTLSTGGFGSWAQTLSGGRCKLTANGVQGYPGQTSTQVRSQFAAALALSPALVVIECGTNNLYDGAATIIGDYDHMVTQARAAGARVIAVCIPRRGDISPADEAVRLAANAGIRGLTTPFVTAVDTDEAFDPAIATYDTLHTNAIGAQIIGAAVANVINANVDPYPGLLFTENDDPLNGVANGFFEGVSGPKDTFVSGDVADGWGLLAQYAGGATVVGSKATLNGRPSQRIDLQATPYTGDDPPIILTDWGASPAGAFAAGATVEGCAEIECSGLQNVASISLMAPAMAMQAGSSAGAMASGGFKGVLRTMPVTLTEATTFTPQVRIGLVGGTGLVPAGTINIGNYGIRLAA